MINYDKIIMGGRMDAQSIYNDLLSKVNQLLSITDINTYKVTNNEEFTTLVISIITLYNHIQSSNNTELIHNAFLLLSDLVNKKPELVDIKEMIIDAL